MTIPAYPNQFPALTLDFVNSRKLDSRITFSRASAASPDSSAMVDGQLQLFRIDVPRLSDSGLLIEEERTNEELNSATLGAWTRNELSEVTNSQAAPDGTTTASTFTVTTTNAGHYFTRTWQNGGGNSPYPQPTYSVFVKPGTAKKIFIIDSHINNTPVLVRQNRAAFDFTGSTPVVVASQGGSRPDSVARCQSVGNGWYRVSLASGSTAWQPHTLFIGVYDTLPAGFETDGSLIEISDFDYAGTGETVALWGVQREQPRMVAPVPVSSYIPTTGSAATRAPDNCEINGSDFTSFFNFGDHTTVVSWDRSSDITTRGYLYRYLQSTNVAAKFLEQISMDSLIDANLWWGQKDFSNITYTKNKAALAVVDGNASFAVGGDLITPTGNRAPASGSTTRMVIGYNPPGEHLNGHLKRIHFYTTRVSDATLEVLTT